MSTVDALKAKLMVVRRLSRPSFTARMSDLGHQ